MFLERTLNIILVTGGLALGSFFPGVHDTIGGLLDSYLGQLPSVVYDLAKPEVEKAYNYGLKVLSMLAGWFILLFCVELLARALLMVAVSVLRAVGLLPSIKKHSVRKSQVAASLASTAGTHSDYQEADSKGSDN